MSGPSISTISPVAIASLAALTHHRWAIPLIAECDRTEAKGLKYVTFLHRIGISRESLGRTLATCVDRAWLMHNPGAGHPMRPEYVLTPLGERLGPHCRRVITALNALDQVDLGLNKWTLPILLAIAAHPARDGARFSMITRVLPDVTSRALAISLREMHEAGLIDRRVLETYPPTTSYSLTRRSTRLTAAARSLARMMPIQATNLPTGSTTAEKSAKRSSKSA